MKINIQEIQIKIKFVEQEKLKAIISLDFGDFIIKGFRVMKSEYKNDYGDELWLTPPSYQGAGGRYHPIFFMPNKELWKQLEKKVWEEYRIQIKEFYKKQFDLKSEDI